MKKPLENRRGWRWLLLLALCVGIVGAIFFLPHPVVQNVAETSIQGLQYQPQYGQEDGTLDPPTTLTDYDQAAVLACLAGTRNSAPWKRPMARKRMPAASPWSWT